MAKTLSWALALAAAPQAFAFRNTSPFFLFSTSELEFGLNNVDVAQSSSINGPALASIKHCPKGPVFVVRQEGVSTADFTDSRSALRLGHYLSGKNTDIKTAATVPEVLGLVDGGIISNYLVKECGAQKISVDGSKREIPKSSSSSVIEVIFPSPATSNRASTLDKYDAFLDELIMRNGGKDYTVFYTTTAQSEHQRGSTLQAQQIYEMEDPFGEGMHMELKRDYIPHNRRAAQKEGGLFEKYQYLTPGLFMGITAIIPLFLILLVGIRAITALEVSYFAFSKEMGPAAQKGKAQ